MYCPNKNSEEYKEMKRVLGDEITHFIWDSNNGNPIHAAPNGKDSKLFSDLLKVSDSREDAIRTKAKIYTEKFKSVFDGKNIDENREPLVKSVFNEGEFSKESDNIYKAATDKAISDDITNEVDFKNSNDLEQFAESNDFKDPVREGRGDNSYDFVFEKGKELGMTVNPEEVTVDKVQENPGQHPLTAIAYYNRFSNEVTLTDRFKHLTKNDQKRILAHETLHGIVTDKVNKMSDSKLAEFEGKLQGFIDSVKANENLMRTDSVKRVLKAVEEGGLQELITYGFTDKEFAAMLNGEVLRRPGEEEEVEEVRTFWTRLKELIVSVLSDDYTKLDELTDIMDAYLDIDKSSEISRPSNPKVTQEEIDRRNRFTPSDLYAAYSKENDTETKPTEEEITEDDEAKLDNAVNTIKRGLRSRINAIKKNMRESSPDRDILKERADFLERQLKELEESTNIETFVEASEEMIKWIEDDLIGSETLYSSNIMQAKDNWSIMMKVTEDLLKIKNLDNVTGEKDNTVNNRVAQKKLKDLRSKLSDIVRDIYASENKFLIQKSTRTMNEALTEQDLMEALPENFIKANTMELAVYKDKLLQLASALMQNADKNRMAEYRQEYGSPLEAILEELGRNELTKEDKDSFKQKNKDGEWTGSLVSRFSNEHDLFMNDYMSALSRIHHKINLAKDNPAKLKKVKNELKEEINKRKKISAYVNPNNLSDEASKKKEIEELSEKVGRELAVEMVNSAEEKLNEYKADEAAKKDEMESLNTEKAKDDFKRWVDHRDPFKAYDELMSESMDYTQAFAYLEGAPRKYDDNGRRTKWHDSDYDAIQNSELKDLYNFIIESTDKLSKNLPEHVRYKIRHNFVAFIEKSTMTKMKERGLSSDVIVDEYYKTISDSTAEDSSPVYDADNKLIKSVPITLAEDRMMFLEKKEKKARNRYYRAQNSIENYKTVEEPTKAQDKANEDNKEFVKNYPNLIEEIRKEKDKYRSNKSDNFLNAFQLFAMMSVNYKHKMDVLDSVRIARDVYERAVVPEKTPSGKWSTYMGKKVTTKSNKEQTMDALDYAIDSIMFGEKKKKELMGKVKVGVSKEGREAKKRHMEALSELRKRRNRGEMSYEEYEDEKTKLDDLLAENMDINYLSFTRMIDSITKYVYYRHIGWNPRSSIANWFYGEMANNIEASSGQFYNSGNLKVARHQMRSALKKALGMGQDEESKKINNLMLNFGIMYDMLDISYGDGKALTEKAKKFGVLNPFELFKRGEFRNQGLILLAMLDNTKITDRKGNRRKLYDAFDVDGKFNVKEFDNSDGEWDIISDGNQFTKKRNQINGLIRRLHGNYDPSHPLKAKGQSIGRMLMVFKTWMPQGVYSRFGEEMYLDELGASVKGRWRTLYDIGFKDSLTLFKDVAASKWLGGAKLGEDYTKFKDIDIQNMRRNVQELVWLAGMAVATLIGYALLPDDDDDEESSEARKYMANVILDMTARLSGDITMYVSPSTPEQALSIPLMRDIGYTADAIFSVFEEMSEEEYDYKKIAKKLGQQAPGTTQIISVMDI